MHSRANDAAILAGLFWCVGGIELNAPQLDRVFLLSEHTRRFEVAVHGVERLNAQLAHGGVLLFGSHLGSFEVLRVIARDRPEYSIRVVLDKQHTHPPMLRADAYRRHIESGIRAGNTTLP